MVTTPEDVAAPPANATVTASGLAYRVLEAGSGKSPGRTDTVRCHYAGWTTDGKKFDSSYDRSKPADFPLNRVIAGWTEGVQLMQEGAKFRFWIPEALAYQGMAGYPKGMLVFDVELIKVH
jgi:FKBP-type peptidyl-prolyl cis-trans isomerase